MLNKIKSASLEVKMTAIWALASVAFGISVALQHGLGWEPCSYCMAQRLLLLGGCVFLGCSLLLLKIRNGSIRMVAVGILQLLSFLAWIAGAWHAWIQLTTSNLACGSLWSSRWVQALDLDLMAPGVFEIRAFCAQAQHSIASIPLPAYTLLLFTILTGLMVWIWIQQAKQKQQRTS